MLRLLFTLFIFLSPISQDNTSQITTIARLGRGHAFTLEWQPNGQLLAVSSSTGIWLYDRDFKLVGNIDQYGSGIGFWSPDSTKLAVSYGQESNRFIVIWEVTPNGNFREVRRIDDIAFYRSIRWHPDSTKISTGGVIIDIETGIHSFLYEARVVDWITGETYSKFKSGSVWWSPDGNQVIGRTQVGGSSSGFFGIFDAHTGELIVEFKDRHDGAIEFQWSKDGQRIFTGNSVWNADTGEFIQGLNPIGLAEDFLLSDDETHIASLPLSLGYPYNTLVYTDLDKGIEKAWDFENDLIDIDWYPDSSNQIITAVNELGDLLQIEVTTGQVVWFKPVYQPQLISSFAWSPNGQQLATITYISKNLNYPIRLWDIEAIAKDQISPDVFESFGGNLLVPGLDYAYDSWAKGIISWDLDGTALYTLSINTPAVSKPLVVDRWNVDKKIYDKRVFEVIPNTFIQGRTIPDITFSPNFQRAAIYYTVRDQPSVEVYDLTSNTYVWQHPVTEVSSTCWTSDSQFLAVLDQGDNRISIWRTHDWALISTTEITTFIWDCIWSPDSSMLWVAANDEALIVDGITGEILEAGLQTGLATWSPDNRYLAISVGGTEIAICEVDEVSNCIRKPTETTVYQLSWSPNGKWLAYGGTEIYLWDVSDLALS
jgi:hypothetical protein